MLPIHILLIDDEKDYCNTLKQNAYYKDIIITDFQNLEDGFNELKRELRYKAIIFDAKCMLTKEQEVEKFDFLPLALDKLKEFEQQYNIHLPFIINTGYIGEKEISMINRQVKEKKGKVFSKSDNDNNTLLLDYLLDKINKSDVTKLEKEYSAIFQVFEKGYLSNNLRTDLINVLQKKKSSNPTDIKTNLSTLRRILDEIHSNISSSKPTVLPSNLGTFGNRVKHLSGNVRETPRNSRNYRPTSPKYQTSAIENLSTAIYRISSDFGAHSTPEYSSLYQDFPSIYTVQALTFSILEILLWFIELMDNE